MNTVEKVVIVNESDEILGEIEKMQAHHTATLHRAFSVFIFNDNNEMLLQQRAQQKYHSPKLWTNACCSHPKLYETYKDAALRRLQEELGIYCDLEEVFYFIYKAEVGDNLWEHELDHVFVGNYMGNIPFNTEEVMSIKWMKMEEIIEDINNNAHQYTIWFKIIFEKYIEKIRL